MVQTGMSAPFGAAAPAAAPFPTQNGEVKPAEIKEVTLLPPPVTVAPGPPFSPPPQPAVATTTEQPPVSSPARGQYLPKQLLSAPHVFISDNVDRRVCSGVSTGTVQDGCIGGVGGAPDGRRNSRSHSGRSDCELGRTGRGQGGSAQAAARLQHSLQI